MIVNLESFVKTISSIKSLTVIENETEIMVNVRGTDQPFFTLRKADQAISFDLKNFKASQLDFSQFLFALATMFMQGDPSDFMHNVVSLSNNDLADDELAIVKKNGEIVGNDKEPDFADVLSVRLIKWLMKLFSDENTDPILGLVGLARMVEGRWDYSTNDREVVNSNENSNEKHDGIDTVGGDGESN